MKHELKVTTNETGTERSRMIVEVNGVKVDIIADQDGVGVTLNDDTMMLDECGTDWPDDEADVSCGTGCGCSHAA